MKVRFATDVLSDEGCYRILDRIVDLFLDGRHMWDIEDIDHISNSLWIQSDSSGRSSKANLEVLEKCYTKSAYYPHQMHGKLLVVTNNPLDNSDLLPCDAKRCLETPAFVLVENSESDGTYFLDSMIYCFGRQQLQDAQTEAWWHYEHLGGFGEIENRLNQLLTRTIGPPRIFVVVDSDRLYPGHVSPTEAKVRETCERHCIPFKILNKRKIENYIPPSLLWYLNRPATLKAFKKLTQEQRDFYEMKAGFKRLSNNEVEVPSLQVTLFSDVSQHVRLDLCGGFGHRVYELFKTKRLLLKSEDIKRICPNDPNEIFVILDEIERIL